MGGVDHRVMPGQTFKRGDLATLEAPGRIAGTVRRRRGGGAGHSKGEADHPASNLTTEHARRPGAVKYADEYNLVEGSSVDAISTLPAFDLHRDFSARCSHLGFGGGIPSP